MNNAFSAGVGLVPLVGDVAVAAFGTNSRNAALLEEFLRIRGEEFLKSQMAPAESSDDLRGVEGKKENGKRMPKKDLAVVKPGAGMDSDEEAETVKK